MQKCNVCKTIAEIKKGENKALIKELKTGYAMLSKYQYYRGYTLFICKYHKTELHQLAKQTRHDFLIEMSMVAEAVYRAVKPVKMNYELLGNTEQHMHWHLIPRFADDPDLKKPSWITPERIRKSASTYPTSSERDRLIANISKYL